MSNSATTNIFHEEAKLHFRRKLPNHVPTQVRRRRIGGDTFLLGNLIKQTPSIHIIIDLALKKKKGEAKEEGKQLS